MIFCEMLNLVKKNGREVERAAEVRVLLDQPDHVEVTLRRVQTHPRHQDGAVRAVHIMRLVHVPEKCDF